VLGIFPPPIHGGDFFDERAFENTQNKNYMIPSDKDLALVLGSVNK